MKRKEFNDLRGKNIQGLEKIALEKKLEAEKAKMKMLGGKEKNLKVRKNLAKEIAKILTLVREKEIIESLQLKSSPTEVSDGQEKKTK